MRFSLLSLATIICFTATAQQQSPRFVEVQVTDTVRLPFLGMDYEVRMQNPADVAMEEMSSEGEVSDKERERMIAAAETKAKTSEQRFLDLLKTNGIVYRLTSTEHAPDYSSMSERTFDVNTYLVSLKGGPEMEKYFKLTEGSTEFTGTPKEQHFGDPATEAPRLMLKLYENARKEAQALASVTGGRLGKVISAQELPKSEGSVLEQLFRMDKMHGDEQEMMMRLESTHTSTMAFRFELLD